jgi:hypothetical protein
LFRGEPVERRLVLVRGDSQEGFDVAASVPPGSTLGGGPSDQLVLRQGRARCLYIVFLISSGALSYTLSLPPEPRLA